jgi:hypothetical protein
MNQEDIKRGFTNFTNSLDGFPLGRIVMNETSLQEFNNAKSTGRYDKLMTKVLSSLGITTVWELKDEYYVCLSTFGDKDFFKFSIH